MKARTDWNGSKEMDVTGVDSDDVVTASVLYLSVWYSEDISSAESTVDDIAKRQSCLSIGEDTATVYTLVSISLYMSFSLART